KISDQALWLRIRRLPPCRRGPGACRRRRANFATPPDPVYARQSHPVPSAPAHNWQRQTRDTLCRTSLRAPNSMARRRSRQWSQKPARKSQQIFESSCWERIELSPGDPDKLFLRFGKINFRVESPHSRDVADEEDHFKALEVSKAPEAHRTPKNCQSGDTSKSSGTFSRS